MSISWSNTAKLTRLVEALNEHSRAWREVLNKEGDVPEAVGMSELPAATTIGRTSPRQTRREYRVSAPPGGLGRVGSGGHCVTTPEEGALSRGGYGDRYAPYIRAATHAEGIGVTHAITRADFRNTGTQVTPHVGECAVVVSVRCADLAQG